MSDISPRPLATEPLPALQVAPVARFDSTNESLNVQRRFRLAGNGAASRALQAAILAFLTQREK